MLGTYGRSNDGTAQLVDEDGRAVAALQLPGLRDNSYAFFNVTPESKPPKELRISQGGGIAVWQTQDDNGELRPCLLVEYEAGPPRLTSGCPFDVPGLIDRKLQ